MIETRATSQENQTPSRPALSFDPQEFCHYLAECDWTEEQKLEFIQELWKIVLGFVDMGFDLLPIQHVMADTQTLELESQDMLGSINNNIFTTNETASIQIDAARNDS